MEAVLGVVNVLDMYKHVKNRKKKFICANPMQMSVVCTCGFRLYIKNDYEHATRPRVCPICGEKIRLIME